MTPTTRPDGEELLSYLHAAQAVQARLESSLAALGLSLGKLGVLRQLATAAEPMPLSQLARQCACVKSNITQLVDRLEADGLVRRAPDATDRRSIRTSLTDAGRALYAKGQRIVALEERRFRAAAG